LGGLQRRLAETRALIKAEDEEAKRLQDIANQFIDIEDITNKYFPEQLTELEEVQSVINDLADRKILLKALGATPAQIAQLDALFERLATYRNELTELLNMRGFGDSIMVPEGSAVFEDFNIVLDTTTQHLNGVLPPLQALLIAANAMGKDELPEVVNWTREWGTALKAVAADLALVEEVAEGTEAIEMIKKINDEMNDMVQSGAIRQAVNLFENLGSAIASGAVDAGALLTKTLGSISSMLSEIFLWGALAAFKLGPAGLALGTAYLIAALGTGFLGGLLRDTKTQTTSAGNVSSNTTPPPSSVRGTVHTGETVVINYNGDVFTGDEREATTLATVRAGGGDR